MYTQFTQTYQLRQNPAQSCLVSLLFFFYSDCILQWVTLFCTVFASLLSLDTAVSFTLEEKASGPVNSLLKPVKICFETNDLKVHKKQPLFFLWMKAETI